MVKILKYTIISKVSIYLISLLSSLVYKHGEGDVDLNFQVYKLESKLLFALTKPLLFYDGDYYLQIVNFGYNYDKIFVFFPGFPYVVSLLRFVLTGNETPEFYLTVWLGYLLNFALSYLNALILYKILELMVKRVHLIEVIVKLFIFNPTTVYMSSFYSEGVFCFTQMTSLYLLISTKAGNNRSNPLKIAAAFMLQLYGSFTRANGFLSFGYFIYYFLSDLGVSRLTGVVKRLCALLAGLFVMVLPFVIVNYLGYIAFCLEESGNYSFCQAKIPLIYGYLQKKYWAVELFGFEEGRRPINILIVVPTLYFLGRGLYNIFIQCKLNWKEVVLFYRLSSKSANYFIIPEVALSIFLILFGISTMHYNSITRILSGYPFFYLILGYFYLDAGAVEQRAFRFWNYGYSILVIVFAVNHYLPL